MTDIGNSGERGGPGQTSPFERVKEEYGFACLRCGHTWEQTYEIEHHLDRENKPFFLYYTDGERVPSPLATLTCLNCGEHTVRITGTARITAVRSAFPPHAPRSRTPRHR